MGDNRSGRRRTTTQQGVKFLGVSVLAGVVLAGIALPVTGLVGLSAKGGVREFDSLPGVLSTPPLSQRTQILDANGGVIASVYSRDRKVVPLSAISPHMQKALVAIEDSRYWQHGAIDVQGILRALNKNAQSGSISQGASTLTQQYVKNVFVEEAGNDATKVAQATQQTLGRKIKEMKYAIQIEKTLGKKRILQNYLNIVPFGEQAYGVEAASARYFSKHAKDLTLPEAALLAGLVQAPSAYDPINAPQLATKRRNVVLQRMAALGDITQAQATAAKKQPLGLQVTAPMNGCITAASGAGFFCDYVREIFLNDQTFGKTATIRAKRWNQGGLTIRTTLQPQAQQSVQNAISRHVYQSDSVAAAATLIEPSTGKIVAMGQSRPYGFGRNQTQISYSVDSSSGGGEGYQPGSTFKAITAAAALEAGYQPSQTYPSPYQMTYPTVTDCSGNRYLSKDTIPNESKSEVGPYAMPEALKKSVNTYFVSLEGDVGLCPVTRMANNLGITQRAGGTSFGLGASFTLGVNEMSPLKMAAAYAAFANRGIYCTPVAIQSVTDAGGKHLAVPSTKCTRAMTVKTADTINTMLMGVVDDGTGQSAALPDRETAGKTGTTDNRYAAWYVGYTPNMAAAVWMGDPQHQRKMIGIGIGGNWYPKVFGATGPAPVWKDAVSGALQGRPVEMFNTVAISAPGKASKGGGNGNGGTTTPGGAPATTGITGITGITGTPRTTGSTGLIGGLLPSGGTSGGGKGHGHSGGTGG
jgi:membrane peptidoglycan carboxypeptidase